MQVLRAADPDAVADARRSGEFLWLDLLSPTPEELQQAAELFGLHPLAVEDAQEFGQLPKLERYGDWLLLVFYGAGQDADGEAELVETHLFVSSDWLVTVRREPCLSLEHLREGEAPDDRWIVYRVVDALTDSFFPVLAAVDQQIEALEDRVIGGDADIARRDVLALRRSALPLRRVLLAQRDAFDTASSELTRLPGLGAASADYFRDVGDHLRRLAGRADSDRDRLMGVLDMADNAATARLNHILERLTLVSTIFLPLTAAVSFFGMNFGWMVEHIESMSAFLLLGVSLPVLIAVGLLGFFRRRGYLD
ncbi:MAG TPA: magnesium transporter CorA family protein [Capillimicrobium sp.]